MLRLHTAPEELRKARWSAAYAPEGSSLCVTQARETAAQRADAPRARSPELLTISTHGQHTSVAMRRLGSQT